MCDFITMIEQRVLAEEDERTQERVTVAYMEGRESVLNTALTAIGAAVDGEVARETHDEGLLEGLRYALRVLGQIASEWDEEDEPQPRRKRRPVGSVYADLVQNHDG